MGYFLLGIVNIIPRLPLENFWRRDPAKDFDQFARSLEKKGLLTESPAIGLVSSVWYNEQGDREAGSCSVSFSPGTSLLLVDSPGKSSGAGLGRPDSGYTP